MKYIKSGHLKLLILASVFVSTFSLANGSVLEDITGYWTLDLSTGEPAWLKVEEENGKPVVYMRVHILSAGPHDDVRISGDRLIFPLKIRRQGEKGPYTTDNTVSVGVLNGRLSGLILSPEADKPYNSITFTGKKIAPVGNSPDLSKIRFGQPIVLFNGKDLTGWRLDNPDKKNGWSAVNGELVNHTPKTDFSATGEYGNLVTEQEFEDFYLHIEFNAESGQNSGVYLRGMYEVQVVDRDSRMQGIQGVGAVFSLIPPSENAAGDPGTWQVYDITLVDRHVSVVLNGSKVIDNQPVPVPTGGAIRTNPFEPGPIMLQGDHTSIKYRNIYLAPVVKD